MIAILKTACGCERAMHVDFKYPRTVRVPLNKPMSFIVDDADPTQLNTRVRTFALERLRPDGILEYHEVLE